MSKRVAFIHKTRLIIILFIEFIIRNGISPYCPHGLIKVNGVVRRLLLTISENLICKVNGRLDPVIMPIS